MSNIQFTVLILTILGGIIWNRVDNWQTNGRIDRLGEQLNARIDQMSGRIDRVADDLKQFYMTLGRHDKAIEQLERH